MRLEDLQVGMALGGLIPGSVVTLLALTWHGTDAVEVTYKSESAALGQMVVYRADEDRLSRGPSTLRPFDADPSLFKLVAEAQRIQLAGLHDPMLAVATSDVQPLPHQIEAVYMELLPRTPLRFLLADDPGAGKTIMAGLYIKELLLREDVRRCLIVAPGGLVEQWQDELYFKFGLWFDILTNQLIDQNLHLNIFERHPLVIARMDQLSRNDDLKQQLAESEWDLIVVDEAHRMGAHYFGGKLNKTQRFELGELLGQITRHFLLMSATPHSGKEEDFQVFLSLLDRDRFEGKMTRSTDLQGIVRRKVKEELYTFEGKKLFPERIAESVPYELSPLERELYDEVTHYVREGMNRADRIGGKRKNTVGFALTVLQRRLASSPEAIHRSLVRRSERLQRRRQQILDGTFVESEVDVDLQGIDEEQFSAEELETLEEELLDAATAAQTLGELDAELVELAALVDTASRVRESGTDRKWTELSTILQDEVLRGDRNGQRRKLIIFTEHRDTLDYLQRRISSLWGTPHAVKSIHGGVRRSERRQITEEFTKNSEVQILIATDAAGEGLNLQVAHLMVNYDLPWNPNRIEQRFGRIHRIGQEEVCRLWNLVADDTREGDVFVRLLSKLEQMRQTYGGKVFDVLGEAFTERPLRELLLDAIKYGDQPEVRARMHEVIDASVGTNLQGILDERALAMEERDNVEPRAIRAAMDEARARRLQPHYIELAFRAAFGRLGGRMSRREQGRFEIFHVPQLIRAAARGPVASKYDRVTFEIGRISSDEPRADLLAPGHSLHDAVMAEATRQFGESLERGATLMSWTVDEPMLLVGVREEIVDGTGASVGRRFGYAYVDSEGGVTQAGPAPYLDCGPVEDPDMAQYSLSLPWLAEAEGIAKSWIIAHQLPQYLEEVLPRRAAELDKTRSLVIQRLEGERDRLLLDSTVAAEKERAGERPRESADSLTRKAADLDIRLAKRLQVIAQQERMATLPPQIVTAALILPASMFADDYGPENPAHVKETKEVERRGVDLVLARERELGRRPVEQAFNNPGFDILSTEPTGNTIRIEVKARIEGSPDFFVTHNEVITGKNSAPQYRLALVRVDPRGAEFDDVRYLDDPFATTDLGDFDATGIRGDWAKTWERGSRPF